MAVLLGSQEYFSETSVVSRLGRGWRVTECAQPKDPLLDSNLTTDKRLQGYCGVLARSSTEPRSARISMHVAHGVLA